MNGKRAACAAVYLCGSRLAVGQASSQEGSLDRLVRAYSDFVESHDATTIRWKDGWRLGSSSPSRSCRA